MNHSWPLQPPVAGAGARHLLLYSWQPLRHLAGGSDGSRHAGMSQRLVQVMRAVCRSGFETVFISGQPMYQSSSDHGSSDISSRRHRNVMRVGGCRVSHYYGSTASQYAQMSADGLRPLFAFIFCTAAWFAIEQRAIRNTSGWALPEAYLDGEESLGSKEVKLLSLLRAEHPQLAVAVWTDDIQSDKLRAVLPAARRAAGDAARVAHVTNWMEQRELGLYRRSDGTVTVSAHDSAWVRRRLPASPLVMALPFVAHPPPPRTVAGFGARSGLFYCGVAHTSAAQSMGWFLTRVHPRLLAQLRARIGPEHALVHARLTIVGWGWKDLARFGPGCSAATEVRGRGSRCVGAVLSDVVASLREPVDADVGKAATSRQGGRADGGGGTRSSDGVGGGGGGIRSRGGDGGGSDGGGSGSGGDGGGGDGGAIGSGRTNGTSRPLLDLRHAVDDEVLASVFAARRVFIAPCHACTGVATKVVTALRHGIPVVCTSEATRGITDGAAGTHGVLRVEDEPEGFADAVAALLTDEDLWQRQSRAALRFARAELSESVLDAKMGALLAALAKRRCAVGDGQAVSACQYTAPRQRAIRQPHQPRLRL